MANVKNLKKDVRYVLGDLTTAVYMWEMSNTGKPTEQSSQLLQEIFTKYDDLITKINANVEGNKKAYFKGIYADLEDSAMAFIEKINNLK